MESSASSRQWKAQYKRNPNRVASSRRQPHIQSRSSWQQRKRPKFPKPRRPLPILKCTRRQNRHKRHARILRRQRVIDIVAHVKRRRWIALPENLPQPVRIRFLSPHIIHGYHRAKMPRRRPLLEGISKFLSRPSRKKIQFEPLRPLLNLPRRHHKFFLAHIPRLAVLPPIKLLKRFARLLISRRKPNRCRPIRNQRPIVIVPWLTLPSMQFRPSNALPRQKTHRLQCRKPERPAHVHQHAVHIKYQYFRKR